MKSAFTLTAHGQSFFRLMSQRVYACQRCARVTTFCVCENYLFVGINIQVKFKLKLDFFLYSTKCQKPANSTAKSCKNRQQQQEQHKQTNNVLDVCVHSKSTTRQMNCRPSKLNLLTSQHQQDKSKLSSLTIFSHL